MHCCWLLASQSLARGGFFISLMILAMLAALRPQAPTQLHGLCSQPRPLALPPKG